MNKQEFYKKYTVKIRYHDELTTIELKDIDPDELWQWIEQYAKQQRVNENRMWEEWITVCGGKPITLKDIENRIKELTGELK